MSVWIIAVNAQQTHKYAGIERDREKGKEIEGVKLKAVDIVQCKWSEKSILACMVNIWYIQRHRIELYDKKGIRSLFYS